MEEAEPIHPYYAKWDDIERLIMDAAYTALVDGSSGIPATKDEKDYAEEIGTIMARYVMSHLDGYTHNDIVTGNT